MVDHSTAELVLYLLLSEMNLINGFAEILWTTHILSNVLPDVSGPESVGDGMSGFITLI